MATHAIRLLTEQHRDVEKWFEQLESLRGLGAQGNWPHEGWPVRGTTDSGEEIRESVEHGIRHAGPEDARDRDGLHGGIPRHSELSRTATPVASEGDGLTDDAVPGQEFRDLAGHYADGKTHVGLDDERVRAQMFDAATGRPRAEGMIGQRRETLAGVRNQFDAPEVDLGHAAAPQPNVPRNDRAGYPPIATEAPVQTLLTPQPPPITAHGTPAAPDPYETRLAEHDLDHKRALAARLFDSLIAHSVLEEQLLYPEARSVAPDLVDGSLEAHREMRELMDELRHTDASQVQFDHLIDQLHRLVLQHVGDEEKHLFPRLQEKLGTARLEELGALMQERSRVLIGLERRFSVVGTEGVAVIQPPLVPPGHMDDIDGPLDRNQLD
jgi:hemerythrin superfamily protein